MVASNKFCKTLSIRTRQKNKDIMKKIISILMLCIGFANNANAETTNLTGIDNAIYIKSLSANAGEVKKLSICMKNTA